MTTVADLRRWLDLRPLPVEGGWFRVTHTDELSSAILYLLAPPEFSAMHRLGGDEIYHFHAGAPLRLLLLHPDGSSSQPVLGSDIAAGQAPQLRVPAGTWQGSSSAGAWSLVGTTMAPPFDPDGCHFAGRAELIERYPDHAARITALTHAQ